MSTPSADDIGATSTSYSGNEVARVNNMVFTQDVGPIVELFDPEWMAWLAGEIA